MKVKEITISQGREKLAALILVAAVIWQQWMACLFSILDDVCIKHNRRLSCHCIGLQLIEGVAKVDPGKWSKVDSKHPTENVRTRTLLVLCGRHGATQIVHPSLESAIAKCLFGQFPLPVLKQVVPTLARPCRHSGKITE